MLKFFVFDGKGFFYFTFITCMLGNIMYFSKYKIQRIGKYNIHTFAALYVCVRKCAEHTMGTCLI